MRERKARSALARSLNMQEHKARSALAQREDYLHSRRDECICAFYPADRSGSQYQI